MGGEACLVNTAAYASARVPAAFDRTLESEAKLRVQGVAANGTRYAPA